MLSFDKVTTLRRRLSATKVLLQPAHSYQKLYFSLLKLNTSTDTFNVFMRKTHGREFLYMYIYFLEKT